MVEAEKVSVRVFRHSDGVPYTEYNPPSTSTGHGESPNERYIEVSTNERYYIEVKLLRGFKFLGYPKVQLKWILDNNPYYSTLSRNRPSDCDRSYLWHREDAFNCVDRTINGKTMRCGLVFGQLESGLYICFLWYLTIFHELTVPQMQTSRWATRRSLKPWTRPDASL